MTGGREESDRLITNGCNGATRCSKFCGDAAGEPACTELFGWGPPGLGGSCGERPRGNRDHGHRTGAVWSDPAGRGTPRLSARVLGSRGGGIGRPNGGLSGGGFIGRSFGAAGPPRGQARLTGSGRPTAGGEAPAKNARRQGNRGPQGGGRTSGGDRKTRSSRAEARSKQRAELRKWSWAEAGAGAWAAQLAGPGARGRLSFFSSFPRRGPGVEA